MRKSFKARSMRPAILIILFMLAGPPGYSGGILNKQNFSSSYAGALSRNATTNSLDTVVYNPGAVTTLSPGGSFGFDLIGVDKKIGNRINSKTFSSDNPTVIPALFGVLRRDDWAVFSAITIPGGGGKLEYPQGELNSFTIGASLLNNVGAPFDTIGPGRFDAESFAVGYRVGFGKELSEKISVAVGIRYINSYREVSGSASINGQAPVPAIQTDLSYEQEASGNGYFAGVALFPNEWLSIGLHYESKVKIDYKTIIKQASQNSGNPGLDAFPSAVLAANQIVQGQRLREDLPAVLGVGASYRFHEHWYLTGSYTLYLEKDALWESRTKPSDNSYDLAFSLGWDVSPRLTGELGILKTDISLDPDQMLSVLPELDGFTVGANLRWKVNDKLMFSASASNVDYDSATTSQGVVYSKEALALSMGFGIWF